MGRFRRVSDGKEIDRPIPDAVSLQEAIRMAAAGMDFEVEVVHVYPITVRVIEIELPPVPDESDRYWPPLPEGILYPASALLFLFLLHRYHH